MELQRSSTVVIGISGAGKSTLVKGGLIFDHDRVYILDHKHEYDFGPLSRIYTDFERMALETERLGRHISVWRGPSQCEHQRAAEVARAVGEKPSAEDALCGGWVDHVSDLALAVGSCLVVVEEASKYRMRPGSPYEEAVLRTGRDRRVSFLHVSQRPPLIDINVRSNATAVYAFLNTEGSSTDWLKPYFGERRAELPTLPMFHALHWDCRRPGEVREIVVGE